MLVELVVLRLLHVLLGAFWVGAIVFSTFFLMPAMRESGPAAAPVMAGIQKRRYMMWLPIAAALTLLSGIRLLWIHSQGFSAWYFQSTRGLIYGGTGLLAILAFAVGFVGIRPAMAKAGALSQRAQAVEGAERQALLQEAQRYRERAGKVGLAVAWTLILVTAGMAVARYL